MLIIDQMYSNTLGLTVIDCRVLRLDTKAQATRRTGTTEVLDECERESIMGRVSKLITHKIQLTLLAVNS